MTLKRNISLQIAHKRARAFSIIQLLISLVITAVVLGGAFVLFGKWKANLSVAERQERLREKASIGITALKKDINSALRDNFDSRFPTFRGIEKDGSKTSFYIQAYEGSFAASLQRGNNFISIDSRFEDDNSAVAGFTQLVGFLQSNGQLVANIEGRQLMILRDSYAQNNDVQLVQTNGTVTGINLFAYVNPQDSNATPMSLVFDSILAGRDRVFFRVTPVRKVDWVVSSGGYARQIGSHNSGRTTDFPNLKKLTFQYSFGVYDDWMPKSLPSGLQTTPLPDYRTIDGANCGSQYSSQLPPNCVNGNDVTSLLITATFTGKTQSTYPAGNWQPIEGSSFLRDENQDDYAIVITETIKPSAYFKGSAANASLVDPTCQVLEPYRCHPGRICDNAFTDSDRNSPNWAGYRAGSPYCSCCADDAGNVRDNCESNPMDFGTLAANQATLTACAQAFGCGYTDRAYVDGKFDPAHFLACECVLPDVGGDALHSYKPDNLVYETEPDLIGPGSLLTGASDNNLMCDFYSARNCGAAAQALSPGVFGGSDIWEDVCSCRSFRVNANGIEVGEMYGSIADYEALCNGDIDLMDADGTNIACSNTIEQVPSYPVADANGYFYQYKAYVNSDGHPDQQKLSARQQTICACLKASNAVHDPDTWNLARSNMTTNSQSIPGVSGVSAPIGQIIGQNPRTGGQIFCANEVSSFFNNHPGGASCVADGHFTGAQLEAALNGQGLDSSNALAQDNWAGWCDPKCKTITNAYGLRTVWNNARMALTGASDLASVPGFCHGPSGNSSSGVQ